ncbi:MAG: glycosyltransferase family 4 protein [Promethearchaeia archaeon]
MKVLRVSPYPPDYLGGLPLYVRNLSVNLVKEKNISSDIISADLLNKSIEEETIHPNVKVIYKKCYYDFWGKYPIFSIINFLKKNYQNYDLIHTHGYYFSSTIQCLLLKQSKNFPLILHIHGGIQTSSVFFPNIRQKTELLLKNKIFDKILGNFIFKFSNALISVSKKDLLIIRKKYKIPSKNYFIPNGVDINKFVRNDRLEKKYITLIATRLTYVKGVDIFLKIIRELHKRDKNLNFLIIGDGPLKPLVLKAKDKLPLKYYPKFPYDNIQDIYNKSKLLLITSRTEGIPNIIYESLACETPVISTNVGGISDVIFNDFNGYLFNLSNYKTAVNYILELLNDESKIKVLGKNGRNFIEKNFSWKIIIDKIFTIYKMLI